MQMWASLILRRHGTAFSTVLTSCLVCALLLTGAAQAQTYTVLHNFSGGVDGATPMAGVTFDAAGNLYGTASYGGNFGSNCGARGCGLVYRLSHNPSNWILTQLYSFRGGSDGMTPQRATVVFGPDGSLYSTTYAGGGSCNGNNQGCGTVFKLQPPASSCQSVSCSWTETILHSFNGIDGTGPLGAVVFDQQGNVDGATNSGGFQNGGTVFQLDASGGYMESILFHPYGYPGSSVHMDHAGNLYGSTFTGMDGPGTIYELTPSGSNWTSTQLYTFTGGSDGGYPLAGVIFDNAGNLYGATTAGGAGQGGTVFKLSPSNGGWAYSLLYSFTHPGNGFLVVGPIGNLAMDAAGNLYGTTFSDGAFGYGAVFKLTPSGEGWTYTSLHDFTNGVDGGFPYSDLVLDANGSIYGTASTGGAYGSGVVFQIVP
jgi:uncharacterized repeat protein (TIGR03803 family)